MATLYQINNDGLRAERWDIGAEPFVVGRSREARVRLQDDGVSRRHFLIVREGEEYVIKDLNSRNGTWLDGCRVFSGKLHHNDCIVAGHTRFLFAEQPTLSSAALVREEGPHGTRLLPALRSALA